MSRAIATTSRTQRSQSRYFPISQDFRADFSNVGYNLKLCNLHLIKIVHANKGWKKGIFLHPIAIGRVERLDFSNAYLI